MSGSAANARVWLNGSVSSGPVGTTSPTDVSSPLNAAFRDLGLLSEDGTEEAVNESADEFFSRGGALVRVVRSKHKRTIKVTVLEDNPVVFGLINPGSTSETDIDGLTTRAIKVPTGTNPQSFVIEDRDGPTTRRKCIARGEVLEVGPAKAGPEMTMRELTIVVYPSADGVLYTEITDDPAAAPDLVSISVTPATVSLAPAATQQLVVTATYDDGSTLDVTTAATFVSGTPAKATVNGSGLVTAVATGSSVITATYQGETDTTAVTVTA